MAVQYTTQGFVFKKQDRLEADRVFSVFTQDFGRVELFGKSIRKIGSKLRAGMDLFYFSDVEFVQGKNKKTLTDAIALKTPRIIAQNPQAFKAACTIGLLLDRFIRGQEKDQAILDLLHTAFDWLSEPKLSAEKYRLAEYYFFWNFIAILGHAPELYQCSKCRGQLNPSALYFSNQHGGLLCQTCSLAGQDRAPILPDAVKLLRLLLKKERQTVINLRIGPSAWQSCQKISQTYCQYLLSTYDHRPKV